MQQNEFPQGYILHDKIDLMKNKKQFWTMQGISVALLIATLAVGCLIAFFTYENPFDAFNDKSKAFTRLIALIVLIAGLIVYVIGHEAVHGVFMYSFSKVRIKFGFNGLAAWAGSDAYFNKKQYLIIALAPLVIWGIVLAALNIILHFTTNSVTWFAVVWFIQAMNISGAAGDIYVSCKMTKYPKDILVQDTGTAMTIFKRNSITDGVTEID